MSNYISSNANRFYVALEENYAQAAPVTAGKSVSRHQAPGASGFGAGQTPGQDRVSYLLRSFFQFEKKDRLRRSNISEFLVRLRAAFLWSALSGGNGRGSPDFKRVGGCWNAKLHRRFRRQPFTDCCRAPLFPTWVRFDS